MPRPESFAAELHPDHLNENGEPEPYANIRMRSNDLVSIALLTKQAYSKFVSEERFLEATAAAAINRHFLNIAEEMGVRPGPGYRIPARKKS